MATSNPNENAAIVLEDKGAQTFRTMLFDPRIQQQVFASLPPGIAPQKFAALCLDQLAATLAPLDEDTRKRIRPELVLRAAQRTAALGLYPGKGASEVAWIFRKGWAQKGGNVVPDSIDVMPQWQGFARLMRQVDGISYMEAHLVHETDHFRYINGRVEHEYDPFAVRDFLPPKIAEDRKVSHGLRGGYLRIVYENGLERFHVVPFAKIDANRHCAKKPDEGIWLNWYPEMVLKTIWRDAAARRVVDYSVDQLERLRVLREADDEIIDADPTRGGHLPAPTPSSAPTKALPVAVPQTVSVPVQGELGDVADDSESEWNEAMAADDAARQQAAEALGFDGARR